MREWHQTVQGLDSETLQASRSLRNIEVNAGSLSLYNNHFYTYSNVSTLVFTQGESAVVLLLVNIRLNSLALKNIQVYILSFSVFL